MADKHKLPPLINVLVAEQGNDEEELGDDEFEDALEAEVEINNLPTVTSDEGHGQHELHPNSLKALQERAEFIQKSGLDLAQDDEEEEEEEEEDEGEEEEQEEASSPDSPLSPAAAAAASTGAAQQLESSSSSKKKKKKSAGIKLDKKKIKQILDAASESTLDRDMQEVEGALELFLDSKFNQAEELLSKNKDFSLYHSVGFGVIRLLKAIFTFDPEDIKIAKTGLSMCAEIANVLRKRSTSTTSGGDPAQPKKGFISSFANMLSGAAATITGQSDEGMYLRKYSRVQRHAELIYAESQLLKSLLTLITDTNLVAFVREGFTMRNCYSTLKACYRFVERVWDEEGEAGYKKYGIDEHFVSGVLLSSGMFNLVLSMLPSKILKIFEMIGFSGDREYALNRLGTGAGWPDSAIKLNANPLRPANKPLKACFPMPPRATSQSGGLRKPLCDLMLISYHVVFSSIYPVPDCNLPMAKLELDNILVLRPQSFIFLFIQARALQTEGRPEEAEAAYMKVLRIQKDWRQLVHVCLWDLGICRLSQGKWKEAEECYTILYEESNWSKVVYRYLQAMCVYAQVGQEGANKVKVMIADMPKHVKKIAGKSLPMEKFLCRKARKFVQQGDRLFLPQFEVLYFLYSMDKNSFERYSVMIREIDQGIRELERDEKSSASAVTNANGSKVPYATYFDDLCLARYLKAICEREKGFPGHLGLIPSKPQTMQAIIFRKAMQLPNGNGLYYDDKPLPVSLSKEEVPMKEPTPTQLQSLRVAILNFQAVKQQSVEIELDHWMLAFTCYEMGVLYMRIGEWELARREFEMSLGGAASDNGEQQVVHQHTGGKVSMEASLHLRAHNAIIKLDHLEAIEKAATGRGK